MNVIVIAVFAALALAAVVGTFLVMTRASRGYEKAKQRRVDRGPTIPCSTCKSWMGFAGLMSLKSGDEIAEGLGHDPRTKSWTVEVYKCPTCRKIEMFLPPAAG